MKLTLKEITTATGGKILDQANMDLLLEGVSTDTRSIGKGELFVALVGERFDGHAYVDKAAREGAAAAIVSRDVETELPIVRIIVDDTKIAYEALAAYVRQKLNVRVVAVTGSVGKTSTREMLKLGLSGVMPTHGTDANLNNEIGLSSTILHTPDMTEALVLEMGMRLRGEIEELTMIAKPDVACITNIGVAHIERLGSRENIMKAKLEIVDGLAKNGLLIIPAEDAMLISYMESGALREDVRVGVTGMHLDATYFSKHPWCKIIATASNRIESDEGQQFDVRILSQSDLSSNSVEQATTVSLNLLGNHHCTNALALLLLASDWHLNLDAVAKRLLSYQPIGNRERCVRVGAISFVDDSYNAGPESMKSAFETLVARAKGHRTVACLADMLELGSYSKEMHEYIGREAAAAGIDILFVTGDYRNDVKKGAEDAGKSKDVYTFDNKEVMRDKLMTALLPDDFVLVKASHSFAMHTLIDDYEKRGGQSRDV